MIKFNRVARRAALAGSLMMALVAAPASAAECAPEPTSQPFAHLGDYNHYFLAEGGDFEGALRWSTAGSVSIEDVVNPADPGGTRTPRLNADGSISSPLICVDAGRPHLRFGARSLSGTGTLKVDAFHENSGKVSLARIDANGFGEWATTPNVPLAELLGIPADGSRQVRLRITAAGGAWLVDGVYVDPYLRG